MGCWFKSLQFITCLIQTSTWKTISLDWRTLKCIMFQGVNALQSHFWCCNINNLFCPYTNLFLLKLLCRRHLEARADEEHNKQHLDPEKLLYPAVDPANTLSASMIQPEAGRVYTISGLPPKPRKWKGSQLSLSDRSCGFYFCYTWNENTQRNTTALRLQQC